MRERAPGELTTTECERVLRDLAAAGPPRPHVVFTGGDPLKRGDLLSLIRHAVGIGLDVSVAPSATTALTRATVADLKQAGTSAMSLSIDGPSAALHDGLRGILGCFGWTLVAASRIIAAGIPLQINTLVTADSEPHLEEIGQLVAGLGAARWSLFFLVNVGRGRTLRPISPMECEHRLQWLAAEARTWPFTVTTTEAPQFRRVMVQRLHAAGRTGADINRSPLARAFGIRDGNGILFIAANGDVTPSGFLPMVAGNVRETDPVRLYQQDPLFRALRDSDGFHGRCGECGFRRICGGSRARAWAASGDVLGEDPLCTWQPVPELAAV
jgi:radical SAM protein with 4Fe4S-binding SPASM domain